MICLFFALINSILSLDSHPKIFSLLAKIFIHEIIFDFQVLLPESQKNGGDGTDHGEWQVVFVVLECHTKIPTTFGTVYMLKYLFCPHLKNTGKKDANKSGMTVPLKGQSHKILCTQFFY